MKRESYNCTGKCVKCGAFHAKTQHRAVYAEGYARLEQPRHLDLYYRTDRNQYRLERRLIEEWLERTCVICGHVWEEAVLA